MSTLNLTGETILGRWLYLGLNFLSAILILTSLSLVFEHIKPLFVRFELITHRALSFIQSP